MKAFIDKALGQLKEFFGRLTKKEKIRLFILVILIIVLAIVAVALLGRTKYVDLFTDIPANEAGAILEVLAEMDVPTRTPNDWTIQVPENMASQLRMKLTGQGYNSATTPTDLSLIQQSGISTMTDKEYETLLKYQLQEDIKNLLKPLPRVKSCTVMLNPKEAQTYVFSPSGGEASCAVVLELVGSEKLSNVEANTIITLIANGVAGLKMENIALSDTNLNQYSLTEITEEETVNTTGEIAYRVELEDRMRSRMYDQIYQFLAPVFGEKGFSVLVNLELDFDDYKSTEIEFSPPVPDETEGIVRSMSEELKTAREEDEAEGVPGTDTNGMGSTEYPYGLLDDGAVLSEFLRQYNYEINELTTEIQKAKGYIKSLSIGVTIDSVTYPEDCSEQVQKLVATAAGTSMDSVWVLQLAFPQQAEISDEEIQAQEAAERQREIIRQVTTIGVPVLLGLAILWLIYAIFKLFAPPKPEPQPVLATAVAGGTTLDYVVGMDDTEVIGVRAMAGGVPDEEDDEDAGDAEEDELMNYQDVEISAKLSGVVQLEKFIDKDPKAVAQLLRNWLSDDN